VTFVRFTRHGLESLAQLSGHAFRYGLEGGKDRFFGLRVAQAPGKTGYGANGG
jgi:hypothetical protein